MTEKKMVIKRTDSEIFRFDKNIVTNLRRIESLVDQNSTHKVSGLVNTLLCFFSWEYQHNLFFNGVLYPDKFAKEYKLDIKDLQRKCENPYQLQDLTDEQQAQMYQYEKEELSRGVQGHVSNRLWDSVLENALYVLSHRTISIQATGGYYSDEVGHVVKGTVGVQVLKSVICELQGRTYVYRYVLNPDFVKNLTGYFLNANRSAICLLRPKHLDNLYMNLVNLKNNLLACDPPRYRTEADNTPSFDVLCAWADIPKYTQDGKTEYEPRKRKSKLNAALKVMIEEVKILSKVEWCYGADGTGSGKGYAAYIPCLFFSEYEAKPDVQRDRVKREFKKMFKEELLRHLFDRYREMCYFNGRAADVNEECFYDWLESKENEEEKKNAFETACFIAYKNIPSDSDDKFKRIQQQFHSKVRFNTLEV